MSMAIKPKTRDPAAMMRDGHYEPERVFPPPPTRVLEGDLDERAWEMLEFIVGVFRISQFKQPEGEGVHAATLQRWYDVGNSGEMRSRIYAALTFLATEGYLRPGPKTRFAFIRGLGSDYVVPTQKGFSYVDRRHAPLWKKARLEFADRRGWVAALVAAVAAVATLVLAVLQILELLGLR